MREATSSASTVYYFAADHLGSTSVTMDASGFKIGEMKYYPFGETRYTWGGTPTDRRFTGQREENGLGSLYDYGARFYSPVLGRFISADTLVPSPSDPQQLNRYAYGLNNPVKYRDPSGHAVTCGTTADGCEEPYAGHPLQQPYPPGTVDNAWNFATGAVIAVGTALLGGGLIGAGSNLVRAAVFAQNVTKGLIGAGLVEAGTGVLVGDAVTVASATISGQKLDPADILINSASTGGAGFVGGIIPGFGGAALGLRALFNGLFTATTSEMSDIAHGRPVDVGKAVLSGGTSALLGAAADKLGSIMNQATSTALNNPLPYSSLAKFVAGRKADNALGFGIVNAFTIQSPLYLFNALAINNQK